MDHECAGHEAGDREKRVVGVDGEVDGRAGRSNSDHRSQLVARYDAVQSEVRVCSIGAVRLRTRAGVRVRDSRGGSESLDICCEERAYTYTIVKITSKNN